MGDFFKLKLGKGDDPASLIITTTIYEVALIVPFCGIVILNGGRSTPTVK